MGTEGSANGRRVAAGVSSSHIGEVADKTNKGRLWSQEPYRTAGLSIYHDVRD